MTHAAELIAPSPALAATNSAQGTIASGSVLWITGLAGSGKSTLACALQDQLTKRGESVQRLDGDQLRRTLDAPDLQDLHDREQRLQRAWRIAQQAQALAARGQAVIVATISLFHAVQRWNRQHTVRYAEIWLDAPIEHLRPQRPQLYGDAEHPAARWVWGLDLLPEYPPQAELHLRQDFAPASRQHQLQQALTLWTQLQQRALP